MRLKYLAILLLFALLQSCNVANEQSCKSFHEGTYAYSDDSPFYDNLKDFQIIRTKNQQIEFNSKTGDSTIWNVKWIDDCTCQLQFSSSNFDLSGVPKELELSITPVNDSIYSYKADLQSLITEGKIIKVKE